MGRSVHANTVRARRAFWRSSDGNVAMLWALVGAVLVGLVGLTVDFTRALTIRAQLQNAADGAALIAERNSDKSFTERQTLAEDFFNTEAADYAADSTFNLSELESGGHRVDISYVMPTTLARVIKNQDWTIDVSAEAEAQASPPIEVALALDNTGSMRNDMQALRDGATDLVSTLLSIDGDTVSVSLVPFVAQVNVGTSHTSWMDQTGVNPYNGIMLEGRYLGYKSTSGGACTNATNYPTTYGGFSVRWIKGSGSYPSPYTNTGRCYAFSPASVNMWSLYSNLPSAAAWGGCVEMRPPPYDIDDTAPSTGTPASMFVPFFSLDDDNSVSGPDNNWITSTTYDTSNPLGVSGWTANSSSNVVRTLSVYKYRSGVSATISNSNSSGTGPNRGCPTPIVPLTTDKDTLDTAISDMTYWNGGGTNQIEGLAWAWRTLSPGAPFTEGRPYDDPTDPVRKVIVLFTDGDNTSLNSNNNAMESDYAALGYRSLWHTYQTEQVPTVSGSTVTWSAALSSTYRRSGITSSSTAVSYMNTRQETLCQAIRDLDIEIYTIGFRITAGGTADNLLRNCATQDGSHFYHADNQSELLDAFRAIGSGIGKLRITH